MPGIVGGGGGLVCESVGKVDRLSVHFDRKQSRESLDLVLTGNPSPCLTTFAIKSSEVRRLLLDLDPYGGMTNCVSFFFSLRELLMLTPPPVLV